MKSAYLFFGILYLVNTLISLDAAGKSKKLKVPERGFISSLPAKTWEEGLICGNGTIGVNILSRPLEETIIFSHERLFLPQGAPTVPPDNSHMLFEIRNLIDRGLYKQATELAFNLSGQEGFMYPDPFVPAFDVNLQMKAEGEVNDYMRSVDFKTGEATVHWSDDRGVFERKMFVSRADGIAVLLITGPAGAVDFNLSLNPRKPSDNLDLKTIGKSYKVFENHVSDIVKTVNNNTITYKNSFTKAYPGSIHAMESIAKVVQHNGELIESSEAIEVKGAEKVLVLFDLVMIYDAAKSEVEEMKGFMSGLNPDYQTLLERHAKIHGEMFNRMKLELGGGKDHLLTTEKLIEKSTSDHMNMALLEKEFDAARYNIISCIGELPPTLQGVWGGTYVPGWASDFTHNGNVPSAIASLLMGNMPELMMAYISYMESIVPYMEINAKHIFNSRGIVLPSRSTTHAYNNALNARFAGGFWVAGAAWAAHFFYDYYLYTGDHEFMVKHGLPFMEKAALFFEDYLYENKDGIYVFSPTQSPENTPKNIDSQGTFNATMDVAAAKELLTNVISVSKELGVNADKISLWTTMLEKMPPYMITDDGIIKEWLTPKLENNDDHRHSSQLYPLYDGISKEIEQSKALQDAFKKSIEYKLDKHWRGNKRGFMSFGLVQLGQAATSLGEGELAYECLQHLVNRFWLNNLASMHNHRSLFNMDISGGMPAVIIKMLVASEPGKLYLLPALSEKFPKGSIEGVLCRGQVEVKSLSWDDKTLNVSLLSAKDQTIKLVMPSDIAHIAVTEGNSKIGETGDKDSRNVSLEEGKIITLNMDLR
ncbi:glycosyl hydrolase family 95 catalytic domain-containing protein [Saccharicrinis sp. GN24d3]|uniref:glycosyl hydrolase family 95 catalytic domain-containing protein n=1 Tax=Saccharicrinis sp. GN24d3 TaxID=3458416 RepID=UPI0040372652